MAKKTKKKVSAKRKYQQATAEKALEDHLAQVQSVTLEVREAYEEADNRENTTWNATEASEEWEELRRIAQVSFPEGSDYYGLSPKNRLVAIASCLGWSVAKIAKGAGLARNTVYAWLKRPDLKKFMYDFNVKAGQESPDQLKRENAVLGFQFINKLLQDKDAGDATKRLKLQAAIYSHDREYGKPNQPVEHRGAQIKELLTQINKTEIKQLDAEAERSLFEPVGADEKKIVH